MSFLFPGVSLTRDHQTGKLRMQNHLSEPVFASSSSVGNEEPFSVLRLAPGDSAEVFDPLVSREVEASLRPEDGPVDVFSLKISFCKGWGGRYARRDVDLCPCWVEVCVLSWFVMWIVHFTLTLTLLCVWRVKIHAVINWKDLNNLSIVFL